MSEKPKVPKDVIEEIELKPAKQLTKTVKVSYDGKQFSIKIPASLAIELNLKKTDKFEIFIEDKNTLKLKRL